MAGGSLTLSRVPADLVDDVEPLSESLLETWGRVDLRAAGLDVEVQVEVRDPRSGRRRRLDMVVRGPQGRVAVVELGGAVHDGSFYDDRARDHKLRTGVGLEVVYGGWADLAARDRRLLRLGPRGAGAGAAGRGRASRPGPGPPSAVAPVRGDTHLRRGTTQVGVRPVV